MATHATKLPAPQLSGGSPYNFGPDSHTRSGARVCCIYCVVTRPSRRLLRQLGLQIRPRGRPFEEASFEGDSCPGSSLDPFALLCPLPVSRGLLPFSCVARLPLRQQDCDRNVHLYIVPTFLRHPLMWGHDPGSEVVLLGKDTPRAGRRDLFLETSWLETDR